MTQASCRLLGELRDASYSDKASIAERLGQTGHRSVRAVLTAMLDDRLCFRNSDQKIFIVKAADADPLELIDPLSLKPAGTASADARNPKNPEQITRLRSSLRMMVARFSLSSSDVSVRRDAVREMSRSLDEPTVALLRKRMGEETDPSVKKEIATALALATLDGKDSAARLQAIGTLSQSVSQDVRNRLALLLDKSADGSFAESDSAVRAAAAVAVDKIDRWRSFYAGIETLFLD